MLILGCMNLGGGWSDSPLSSESIENALACVRAAIEEGISSFDHADIYCGGKSESAFGHVWGELGIKRNAVRVQSKCGIRRAGDTDPEAPHRFDFSHEHITGSVKKSLERLKTDYLDTLLLHRPDPLLEPEEVARAFSDLRTEGLVRAFGVSNFNAAQMTLLASALPEPLTANQVEFNLLHSDLLDESVTFNNVVQRGIVRGDGTLEYCRLHGVEIQAYSPIAKGRLTPPAADADEKTRGAAGELVRIAAARSVPPGAIMLAWILRHPANIRPVIGSTRPGRIRELAKASDIRLTREEWYRLYVAGRGRSLP